MDLSKLSLQELQDHKTAAHKKIEELKVVADGSMANLDGEQRATWDQINSDYDDVSAAIIAAQDQKAFEQRLTVLSEDSERVDHYNKREHSAGRPGMATDRDRDLMFSAFIRSQYGYDPTPQQQRVCNTFRFKPEQRFVEMSLAPTPVARQMSEEFRGYNPKQAMAMMARNGLSEEQRQMVSRPHTNNVGGESVSPGFIYGYERALLAYGGLRAVSNVVRTPTGEPMHPLMSNDTAQKATIVSEATILPAADEIPTSRATLNAFKYVSSVDISPELLQDGTVNWAAEIPGALGTRVGRGQADHWSQGTGTTQPTGLLTTVAVGKTAASATALTADEIIELQDSIDPAYEQGAQWVANKKIFTAIRLLKDTTDNYIWTSGWRGNIVPGAQDMLLGDPIHYDQSYPDTLEIDAKVLTYGNHSHYMIRDAGGLRLQRLTEVKRLSDDLDVFAIFHRADGIYVNAGTDPIKCLQMAAA